MKLKVLSIFEFDEFSKNHPLGNYHQSSAYAMMMCENKYDYELIGMIDENNNIVAASLILFKRITIFTRYGYAPKGFLIDYNNINLVKQFCELLKKRYYKKNFAFIKINPEIEIGTIDPKSNNISYNQNKAIENNLINIGFKKLKDNKYFELLLPKFNAVIDLKDYSIKKADKRTRNKIRKSIKKGFIFEKGNRDSLETIYKFINKKKNYPLTHYLKYYNAFSKNDNIDIFLIKIDFEKALIATKNSYEKEIEINNKLTNKFLNNNNEENLRKKMDSDQKLDTFNNQMADLNNHIQNNKEEYVAGAITIKFNNKVSILISGFNTKYKSYCPNYFLHYKLIEYYKNNFEYLDLNGMTGDLSKENPYKGLNEFKLGFNPHFYETIGELDYVINESVYTNIDINGILQKEFDRSKINTSTPEKITNPPKKVKEISTEPKKSFITISK